MSEQLLNSLNDAQRTAVSAPLNHLLILAGAGSGKTRVLVHRIAWLLEVERVSPFNILAVTFTNKAAAEMRGRIEELLGIPTQGMWVGTFHGLAHRLLRLHWQEAKLAQHFQILDSDDQYRLIRRIVISMGLDEKQWAPKQIQYFINGKKDEGLRPAQLQHQADPHTKTLVRIYQAYEETCERNQAIDFAELLLRAYELWLSHPELLAHYQQRFQHVLVDEFQDTNTIQYAWIKLLAKQSQNYLMAVGDDDQSIYGWRGAKVENMQRLQRDFPSIQTIRLEQNYRSTGTILKAANALISNNDDRLGKNLWTAGGDGEAISVYAAFNEMDEARFIIDRMRDWIRLGNNYKEIAVLYRSNAQSRILEEILIQAGIPYRIYGGLRFFERAEIKDALAYLRLLNNRDDDTAFERVINTPTRGIGEQTLATLREHARTQSLSLWKATQQLITTQAFSSRAQSALQVFVDLINNLHKDTLNLPLSELTECVLNGSGLIDHYRKEKGEKGQTRVENLEELISATKQFQDEGNQNDEAELSPLSAFLANAALEAGDTQSADNNNCVQLMTLHSAKGLEFPLVFLAGVEEGLFPHQLSIADPTRLSEERRLCYVGITRAMKKLFITYAETRRLHGNEMYHRPSRFIREIPENLIQEVRLRTTTVSTTGFRAARSTQSTPTSSTAIKRTPIAEDMPDGFRLGQRVKHPVFGEGTILSYEGSGAHARIQIKFTKVGAKWLVASYAKLEAV